MAAREVGKDYLALLQKRAGQGEQLTRGDELWITFVNSAAYLQAKIADEGEWRRQVGNAAKRMKIEDGFWDRLQLDLNARAAKILHRSDREKRSPYHAVVSRAAIRRK